jgi:PRTRC genetic system protein A
MNGQDLQIKFNDLLEITRTSYETFLTHTEAALREARPCVLAIDEDADEAKLALDMATYRAAPLQAAPQHCEFAPLVSNGHRLLVAQDGMHLEVRRPWLHFIHSIAKPHLDVRIPYGAIEDKLELAFGRLGTALPQLKEFGAYAMAESPVESAASLLWNHKTQEWSIRYPEVIGAASAASIQYKQVDVGEDESLVIDLHSHGTNAAFFSATDNEDDRGSVKIAGVFGNLDQPMPTVAFRLCALGVYLPLAVPADKIFS